MRRGEGEVLAAGEAHGVDLQTGALLSGHTFAFYQEASRTTVLLTKFTGIVTALPNAGILMEWDLGGNAF